MSGPKHGVGIVVPGDFELDDEYWQLAEPDAVLHVTRIPVAPGLVDRSAAFAVSDPDLVREGVRWLSATRPDVTIYACTAGSFIRGASGEAALIEAMSEGGAVRALTTSGAIVQALRRLSIDRVAVAAPYTTDLTAALVSFLEECDIHVVGEASLELVGGIADVPAAQVLDVLRKADNSDVQAIVLSCTNLRTVAFHEDWERQLGKPVITANQATMWAALLACGASTASIIGQLSEEART